MNKFRVGDLVHRTSGLGRQFVAGQSYVVTRTIGSYSIELEGVAGSWNVKYFEIASAATPRIAVGATSEIAHEIVKQINMRLRSPSVEEIVAILNGGKAK